MALQMVPAAWDRGDMMDGGTSGGHWAWVLLIFLILAAFLAAIVVLVVRQSRPSAPGPSQPPTDTAHRILAERLARGEITPEEYSERAQTLDRGSRPAT